MFDWYRPDPSLSCPQCGAELDEWQGKDGPCLFLSWRQGVDAPLSTPYTPANWREQPNRLPASFGIYSVDCPCNELVEAECQCVDGTWTTTELSPRADA